MPRSSKSRKPAARPKRSARRSKPRAQRARRRPALSSKPQRKAKAAPRKPAKARKAPARSARSATRTAAQRPPAPAPRDPTKPDRKALRIVLFGAGGMVGSRIAKELLSRGHRVTAVQRRAGGLDLDGQHVMTVQGDATDPASVTALAKGHDAIACAISPRGVGDGDSLARAAAALLEGARRSGTKRLVVVGGAGSLLVGPSQMLLDTPQFPSEYRPEARAHLDALKVFRGQGQGVDWTFVSPAAYIHPGPRTGRYQKGQDSLLTGKDGKSEISAEDYAVAFVDELERGENKGRRMAVAWP